MAECTEAERLWLDAMQSKDQANAFRTQVVAVAGRLAKERPELIDGAKAAERTYEERRVAITALYEALAERGLTGERAAPAYQLLVHGREP